MSDGSSLDGLRKKDIDCFWHPATQMAEYVKAPSSIFVKGDGYRVWDINGREYIDGNSGLWCVNLGYGEQRLVDAATRQFAALPYCSLFAFSHEPVIELSARLVDLMPNRDGKAFFVTDGSEAIDTAIKMARQYFLQNGQGQRQVILSNRGSYHGLSLGALSATGLQGYRIPFGSLLPGFYQVPNRVEGNVNVPYLEAMKEEVAYLGPNNIAAIIIEPVQASGGVVPLSDDYLKGIAALAKSIGALLILDEVTTGFARTGPMFAYERAAIMPDIVTMSKGLTSGYMPLGAVIATNRIYEGFWGSAESGRAFTHAYTYGGHPVACAVALAVLDVMRNDRILDHVADVGGYLKARLLDLKNTVGHIGEVRGTGLIYGIDLVDDAGKPAARAITRAVSAKAMEQGLIIRAQGSVGHVLALFPPLIIDKAGIDAIIERLKVAVEAVFDALPTVKQ